MMQRVTSDIYDHFDLSISFSIDYQIVMAEGAKSNNNCNNTTKKIAIEKREATDTFASR
jgi:hypothetical protein